MLTLAGVNQIYRGVAVTSRVMQGKGSSRYRQYTDEAKNNALELTKRLGYKDAAAALDIPVATLYQWAKQ